MIALGYDIPVWIIVSILCGACLLVGVLIYIRAASDDAMKRRFGLVRIAKWSGTVACGLCVLGFLVSVYSDVELMLFSKTLVFSFDRGMLGVIWYVGRRGGWSSVLLISEARHSLVWWPFSDWSADGYLYVPWWMILAVMSISTACLWLLDRRRLRPGHCPCGYDLTGNVSGTCPECGREAAHGQA